MVQATHGNLYGTTEYGGANFSGNVFKITPSGTLTTLYSFCSLSGCADGANPYAGLVQATDGNFYGTTEYGGGPNFSGTVFRITPSGKLTTLYSFCSQSGCPDGEYPTAALVQATDGNFYGTTYGGGANLHYGTVFKITPSGTLTTLYSFCSQSGCGDGEVPGSALVQATDGNFYGTTVFGGANGEGTVFKITPSGTLTTLYSFLAFSMTDGFNPNGVVQATDGNFYGTTLSGGSISPACAVGGDFGCGTVFKITPSGTLTTLHSFCSQSGCADGSGPEATPGLIQDTNGSFYGTTGYGGDLSCVSPFAGCGTVFRLSVGLGPFVETQTSSGKVGEAVKILGDRSDRRDEGHV